MSYISQPINNQSLTGIITLTDGYLTIEEGKISDISSLDVKGNSIFEGNVEVIGSITGDVDINAQTFTSSGESNFYKNNTIHTNATTQNIHKIKSNQIVATNANIKNVLVKDLTFTNQLTPTSSNSSGSIGQIRYDDNYIYVYTSTGWKRSSLNPF